MFMANGHSRRLLQNGDEKKVLSICKLYIKIREGKINFFFFFFCFLVEIGVAGSMAGSVMAFLNCPIELLKVKLQTQDPKGFIGANGKLEPAVSKFSDEIDTRDIKCILV